MQENEFEKKMQQKMELLQVQPAGEVWQKIQAQVGKRTERKRRFAIFFFLTACFLMATLFVADLTKKSLYTNKEAEKMVDKNKHQAAGADNLSLQELPVKPQQSVETTASINKANGIVRKMLSPVINNPNSSSKIIKVTRGITKLKLTAQQASEKEIAINENIITEKLEPSKNTKPVVIDEKLDEKKIIILKDEEKKEEIKVDKKPVPIIQSSKQNNKNKLWTTSLLLNIGMASTANKYLKTNTAADYNSGGVINPNPGNVGNNFYSPSATKPGLSFATGFAIVRSISSKTKLQAGLQYQLLTTSIATGNKIDTLLSGNREDIFKSGNSNSYISVYHFISLPVSVSTKITSIKGREININAGVNFSRLIHTNALQFDYTQSAYYKDSKVFNRTVAGLTAGVSINIAGKNKAPFYIGPDFYYSLTPLAASGLYAKSHYSFLGIRLQKVL